MRRALAAAGAAVLLLSGCAAEGEPPSGLYYEATGVAPDAALLTVNGREVPASRYFYWLAADCGYLAQQAGGEPDWSADAGGLTLDSYVKDQALSAAVFCAVIEEQAQLCGCVLTAADLAAMDRDWAAQVRDAGGEDAYLALLDRQGLNAADAQLFSADYYLYEHLCAMAVSGEGPLAPADGEVDAYARGAGLYSADVLTFSGSDAAQTALERLESDPACQPSACGGCAYERVTAAPGDGTLSPAAENALSALEPNQWSRPVETADGASLFRRTELDSEAAAELWFGERLRKLAASARVTCSEEYSRFTAASFYSGLRTARAEKGPSRPAS